jgi:hypothetical protein
MDHQETEKSRTSGDKIAVWAITIVVAMTALLFIWTSSSHRSDDSAKDTWIDDNGHVHVLGIELGKSTLRNAEIILKSRSDIALYIYPDTHKDAGMRLEAYFPSIADHSKVILVLEANAELLEDIRQKATVPHLYPNDVARMNLNMKGIETVQQLVVKELTLIPSLTITAGMLASRFGPASENTTDANGFTHYTYPEIGLEAMLRDEETALLHFANPKK